MPAFSIYHILSGHKRLGTTHGDYAVHGGRRFGGRRGSRRYSAIAERQQVWAKCACGADDASRVVPQCIVP